MKYNFDWKPEYGLSTCTITYKNHEFIGTANCHSDDNDMMSERTGSFIAESRAYRKYMQYVRDCELRPALNALKHTYDIMKQSKYFDEKSHEAQVIRKQIKYYEDELHMIRRALYTEAQYLREYIANKDLVYKRIRKANQQQ